MSNLIERQKVLDGLEYEMKYGAEIDRCGLDTAYDIIENIPSAEPERNKGEWTLYESRSDIYDLEGVCTYGRAYRCSECGFIHWVIEDFGIYSFCQNCGADMRGEHEDIPIEYFENGGI